MYNHLPVQAIGRSFCYLANPSCPSLSGTYTCWLTNKPVNVNINKITSSKMEGKFVYKNTKLGEILCKYHNGTRKYTFKNNLKRIVTLSAEIYSKSTYMLTANSVKEVTIQCYNDSNIYRFQYLDNLVKKVREQQEKLEKLKQEQEEERKKMAAELAAKETSEKQAAAEEIKRKEEEQQRAIAEYEAKFQSSLEAVQRAKSFTREGAYLRSQHILDSHQEDAKRSHLYDGIPIVIEGGPGTGKTTTMIQRLKFLLSKEALDEYESPLTDEQKNALTDPVTRDEHWLFFSPTEQLLSFLRQNMHEEDLKATDVNTTVLETFSHKAILKYKLHNPDSGGPFKLCRQKAGQETAINDASQAIKMWESFCLRYIKTEMMVKGALSTSAFPWHNLALEIKAYCKRAETIKDIDALIRVLNSLHDNESSKVAKIEKELNQHLQQVAVSLTRKILEDASMKEEIIQLFAKWEEETISQESDAEDNDIDEGEEEEATACTLDIDTNLFQRLKPLCKKLSLKEYDSKQRLGKRQQELYDIAKKYIDEIDVKDIGVLAWFTKNYASLCRGVESCLFNKIPAMYKAFRKEQIAAGSTIFNKSLIEKLQTKDKGRTIHREEFELIVGFINNLLLGIHKKSRLRFERMAKHKYVSAYMDMMKSVIGIDEATDYTLIDYYFITSFRHYEYSCITLCGDIMQGLHSKGIKAWDEIRKSILPQLYVYTLRSSYRQIPTLLDLSKQLYLDDMGKEAPYHSQMEKSPQEPKPICFISDDEEQKTKWIAERIIEVYKYYSGEVPSIAILVGDEVDIKGMIEIMEDQDYLNGIRIYDCSNGNTTIESKAVRIFRLSEVKGMEFEVAFFYDIDRALAGCSFEMMRRYLYVGISRATSHLAATFTKTDGNEEIIKYFDSTKRNWRL